MKTYVASMSVRLGFVLWHLPAIVCGDLSFLALGDWGGRSDREPATAAQRLTAAGLGHVAGEMGAVFTFFLGDNFYDHGINTSFEKSSRFRETFESVYYAMFHRRMSFYVMAGDHDYGQGRAANISAEMLYGKLIKKWHFPSLWYKVSQEYYVENGKTRTLDVLVIDTTVLCGDSENEPFIDVQLRVLPQAASLQEGFRRAGELRQRLAQDQWAWIEAELGNSTADFLWVAGHHPIWSGGNHGPTQCLVERLHPLLLRHEAHYMAGHDHLMMHLEQDGFNTFVVGTGKECCHSLNTIDAVPEGTLKYALAGALGNESKPPVETPVQGGFASFQLGAEAAEVSLHSDTGALLYAAPPIPRRSTKDPWWSDMKLMAVLILAGALPAAAAFCLPQPELALPAEVQLSDMSGDLLSYSPPAPPMGGARGS